MTVIGILERPTAAGPLSAALVALDRLIDTVNEETRGLRDGARADLERSTHQKNIGLLELTRCVRALGGLGRDPKLLARLADLRLALEENSRVLALHLAAALEIAELVSETMEEAASDGTYTATFAHGAAR